VAAAAANSLSGRAKSRFPAVPYQKLIQGVGFRPSQHQCGQAQEVVLRVFLMLVVFVRERDFLFSAIAMLVLAIILLGSVLGDAARA
jgi:hypothetical protein